MNGAASVSGGYQYADVPFVGPTVVVVTDNDRALAQNEADRLSNMFWATRHKLALNLPDSAATTWSSIAATIAGHRCKMDHTHYLVCLIEIGDLISKRMLGFADPFTGSEGARPVGESGIVLAVT